MMVITDTDKTKSVLIWGGHFVFFCMGVLLKNILYCHKWKGFCCIILLFLSFTFLYSAILCSQADSLHLHAILQVRGFSETILKSSVTAVAASLGFFVLITQMSGENCFTAPRLPCSEGHLLSLRRLPWHFTTSSPCHVATVPPSLHCHVTTFATLPAFHLTLSPPYHLTTLPPYHLAMSPPCHLTALPPYHLATLPPCFLPWPELTSEVV